MKIEILGMGCPKCKSLEANVKKALEVTKRNFKENGLKAKFVEADALRLNLRT